MSEHNKQVSPLDVEPIDEDEVCPKCQNRFWVFHGDNAVECSCTMEEE